MTKKAVYIASNEEHAGKSVIAMALALTAKDLGIKIGYFKPVGVESIGGPTEKVLDEDAETMKRLLELEDETEVYCPIILRKDMFFEEFSPENSKKYIDEILSAYREASEEKDIMLVEGAPTLSWGAFIGCSVPSLASKLKAEIILVSRFKSDHIVDEIMQARDYAARWGIAISKVIINRVPKGKIERAKQMVRPILEHHGIEVLGIISEDTVLGSLTVREIFEAVGGTILAGKEGLDRLVENVLVGAMRPESAIRYFQKTKNELVITGGDRTDIIFAALEAGATAIILTGNLHPSVKVFPRADDLKVQLILVPYDTYTTLRMVQEIVGKIKPTDLKRIDRAKRLVKENVEWKKILLDGES